VGRILAIDYGLTRIGLALSDPLRIIASPYKTIQPKDEDAALLALRQEIEDNEVDIAVVGLPLSMSGEASEQTGIVRAFIEKLKAAVPVPVDEVDERLSSVEAIRVLHLKGVKTGHKKAEVDKTAAAIFLQTYLDTGRYKSG